MDREDELIFQYAKQVLDLETEIWKKKNIFSHWIYKHARIKRIHS